MRRPLPCCSPTDSSPGKGERAWCSANTCEPTSLWGGARSSPVVQPRRGAFLPPHSLVLKISEKPHIFCRTEATFITGWEHRQRPQETLPRRKGHGNRLLRNRSTFRK